VWTRKLQGLQRWLTNARNHASTHPSQMRSMLFAGCYFDRIRNERSFNQFSPKLLRRRFFRPCDLRYPPATKRHFLDSCLDAFWSLVVERRDCAGSETGDPNTALFHVTEHGRRVFAEPDYQPHDPAELSGSSFGLLSPPLTRPCWPTSGNRSHCYTRGLMVASTMMLGIAAERVFLLVCDSLAAALKDRRKRRTSQSSSIRSPWKEEWFGWPISSKKSRTASLGHPAFPTVSVS